MAEANGSQPHTVQLSNILLGSKSGTSKGQLLVNHKGVFWRKSGSDRTIEARRNDLAGAIWSKAPRGAQLVVRRKQAPLLQFMGLKSQDLESLQQAFSSLGVEIEKQELAVTGRNWGHAAVEGSTLVFTENGKTTFRIPLSDVGQVQQGRDEVSLDFSLDDTGGDREDALVGMSFHVPREAHNFEPGPEDDSTSTKAFHDAVAGHTAQGAAAGDVIATFDSVGLLAPRGRFEVEMYLTSMKLLGQAQDFRVQYDSIARLLVLPKSHTPHTLVVISLDPPIRKGQTYYAHLLCQFNNDEDASISLEITDEQLAAKNATLNGKMELERDNEGPAYDIFARLLRGLAGTRLAKPGKFRTADGTGYALRCSYKADDGYLYPLEKAFFYVHKPPMLITHEEIDGVEFMRQGGGVLAASAKTFDLNVRVNLGTDYLFRNIAKGEWQNLLNFLQAKKIRIDNLREAEMGPGATGGAALDLGDDIDQGLARMDATGEMSSDDEEFDADGAAAEAEAADAEAEAEDSGGSDVEAVPKPKPKTPKAPKPAGDGAAKALKAPKRPKAAQAEDGGAAVDGKKKRKKKDPNAPKQASTAFFYFSNANRNKVKADNPGIAFTDIAKQLGIQWKALDADSRAEYVEQAAADKQRYQKEMAAYKSQQGAEEALG